MPRSNLLRLLVPALIIVPAAGLVLLANGCSHPGGPVSADGQEFAGDAACEGCHLKEFIAHKGTRHATTMHVATREGLGPFAPDPGDVPKSPYRIMEASGEYSIALQQKPDKPEPMQYSLGSGKTGVTFIEIAGDSVRQMHMSYFPSVKKWFKTPGQTNSPDEDLYKQTDGDMARRCIGCHATGVEVGSLHPRPGFLGVGCESCHGPAKRHAKAVESGEKRNIQIERMGTWTPKRINELCGKCHRLEKDLAPDQRDLLLVDTHRFQAFAIMSSNCFVKTNGGLSCLTCHDPHANASKDHNMYVSKCLTCHVPPSATASAGPARPGLKPCPKNPRAKCIECHMRPRDAFAVSPVPTKMVDHLISLKARFTPQDESHI
jgi:hypothetical protein